MNYIHNKELNIQNSNKKIDINEINCENKANVENQFNYENTKSSLINDLSIEDDEKSMFSISKNSGSLNVPIYFQTIRNKDKKLCISEISKNYGNNVIYENEPIKRDISLKINYLWNNSESNDYPEINLIVSKDDRNNWKINNSFLTKDNYTIVKKNNILNNDFGFFQFQNKNIFEIEFKNNLIGTIESHQHINSGGFNTRINHTCRLTKVYSTTKFTMNLNNNIIKNLDLSNLLKLNLSDKNIFSKNGLVWTKAPRLLIDINEDFIGLIQELNKLFYAYELLNSYRNKLNIYNETIFNAERKNWFNIIINNIFYKSKSANEIIKDIKNTFLNIKPTQVNNRNTLYKNLEKYKILLPNLVLNMTNEFYSIDNYVNLKYPYLCILSFLKNFEIKVNYQTINSSAKKETMIWDGQNFLPIKMENYLNSNLNYIFINDLFFLNKHNINIKVNNSNVNKIIMNSNFKNIFLENNCLKYYSLFREDAKNYNNLQEIKNDQNSDVIKINIDKYVSDIIYPNNEIIDKELILTNINKCLYDIRDKRKKLFYDVESINWSKEDFQNWEKIYDEFKIIDKNNNINFLRNNENGIFYSILKIKNWSLKNDDKFNGDFTNNFKTSLLKNKFIKELIPSYPTNDGIFLIKFQSSYLSKKSNINNLNIIQNDIDNPLFILNTPNINKEIFDQLNNNENWIEKIENNEYFFYSIKKIYKQLNSKKQIQLKTDNINLNFVIDKYNVKQKFYEYVANPIQYIFANIWDKEINFSNENNGSGKIINRKFKKYILDSNNVEKKFYEYSLNKKYSFNIISENNSKNTSFIEISIFNKNLQNEFIYNINFDEIIELFKKYKNIDQFKLDYEQHVQNLNDKRNSINYQTKEIKIWNIILIIVISIIVFMSLYFLYLHIRKKKI